MISIKEVCARRKGGLLFLRLETQRESEKEMSVATRKAGRATNLLTGFVLRHNFGNYSDIENFVHTVSAV